MANSMHGAGQFRKLAAGTGEQDAGRQTPPRLPPPCRSARRAAHATADFVVITFAALLVLAGLVCAVLAVR